MWIMFQSLFFTKYSSTRFQSLSSLENPSYTYEKLKKVFFPIWILEVQTIYQIDLFLFKFHTFSTFFLLYVNVNLCQVQL
jgi:hypothetical protein